MRIWHGRHAGPLIAVWVVALVLGGGLYYAEDVQPALSELLLPIYVIVAVAAIIMTWQWFRARVRGRRDRRHGDRRRNDRRDLDEVTRATEPS